MGARTKLGDLNGCFCTLHNRMEVLTVVNPSCAR